MEEELEEKTRIIEELQEDLIKSATLGKGLLDRNNELEQELKEQEDLYTEKLDALEQDNFVLRSKIEAQERLLSEQFGELDQLRSASQEKERKHLEFEKLQNTHMKTVAHLEAKVSGLIDELDSAREEQENMKEKLERQELLLSQWKEKAKSSSNTTCLEVEMGTLQNTVAKLERENEELLVKLQDEAADVSVLRSSEEKYRNKIIAIQEEVDEHLEEINSLHTALQATKEKNIELTQEVQMLKIDAENATKRRGNSLFSEVEDRRIETERRFISLKVKHESLEKAHTVAQHQLRKLKANMRAFLTEKGQSTVVSNHAQRLEGAVASYRSQVEELRVENAKLKKEASTTVATFTVSGDGQTGRIVPKEVADFLQCELERVKKENKELQEKLDKQLMEKLWDTDKLRECEGNLHAAEREAVKLHADAMKYKQKLQESIQKWKEERIQREKLQSEVKHLRDTLAQTETKQQTNRNWRSHRTTIPVQEEDPSPTTGSSVLNRNTCNVDVPVAGGGTGSTPNSGKITGEGIPGGRTENIAKTWSSMSSDDKDVKNHSGCVDEALVNVCDTDNKENTTSESDLPETQEKSSQLLKKAHQTITVNSEEVVSKCSQQ